MVIAKRGAAGGRYPGLVARNTWGAARVSRRPGTLEPVVSAPVPSAQLAFAVLYGMVMSMVFQPLCSGNRGKGKQTTEDSVGHESCASEVDVGSTKKDVAPRGESRPLRLTYAGSASVATSDYAEWCEISSDEDCDSLYEYEPCEGIPARPSCCSDVSQGYVNPVFFESNEGCYDPQHTDGEDYANINDEQASSDDDEYFEPSPALSLMGRYSLRRSFE